MNASPWSVIGLTLKLVWVSIGHTSESITYKFESSLGLTLLHKIGTNRNI